MKVIVYLEFKGDLENVTKLEFDEFVYYNTKYYKDEKPHD